jgi:hypothetical protein
MNNLIRAFALKASFGDVPIVTIKKQSVGDHSMLLHSPLIQATPFKVVQGCSERLTGPDGYVELRGRLHFTHVLQHDRRCLDIACPIWVVRHF